MQNQDLLDYRDCLIGSTHLESPISINPENLKPDTLNAESGFIGL